MTSGFQKQVLIIYSNTHFDLHEEVPQVLLEGGDVLIQAEQTRHKHLHLGAEHEKQQSISRLSTNSTAWRWTK